MFSSLLCAALLAVHVPAFAEDPTPPNDRALLAKLQADDFDERQSALAQLIQRGDAVKALIASELARTDLDADYKTNLKAIAIGLRESDALKPFDNPKRMDFELKNETVDVALKKLSDHFGHPVTARDGAGSKTISLSIKGATFIEVLDAIRGAADLEFFPAYSESPIYSDALEDRERFKHLALIPTPKDSAKLYTTSGPFAAVLTHVKRSKFDQPNIGFPIQGLIYFSPDLPLTHAKVTSISVLDGTTNVLQMPQRGGVPIGFKKVLTGSSIDSNSFMCSFVANPLTNDPLPSGLKWKISLTVEIPLIRTEERVAINSSEFGVPQKLSPGHITVFSLKPTTTGWEMDCAFPNTVYNAKLVQRHSIDPVAVVSPFRTAEQDSDVLFLDPQGAPLKWQRTNIKLDRSLPGGTAIRFTLAFTAKPATIQVNMTSKSQTRNFDFEFPSVPIPLNKAEEK